MAKYHVSSLQVWHNVRTEQDCITISRNCNGAPGKVRTYVMTGNTERYARVWRALVNEKFMRRQGKRVVVYFNPKDYDSTVTVH